MPWNDISHLYTLFFRCLRNPFRGPEGQTPLRSLPLQHSGQICSPWWKHGRWCRSALEAGSLWKKKQRQRSLIFLSNSFVKYDFIIYICIPNIRKMWSFRCRSRFFRRNQAMGGLKKKKHFKRSFLAVSSHVPYHCRHFKPFSWLFLFPWTNHQPFLLRAFCAMDLPAIFCQYKPFESGTSATVGLGWSCGWSKYLVNVMTLWGQVHNMFTHNDASFFFILTFLQEKKGLMAIFVGVSGPFVSFWYFNIAVVAGTAGHQRIVLSCQRDIETIEKKNSIHAVWLQTLIVKSHLKFGVSFNWELI